MSLAKLRSCPQRETYVCLLMDEMHVKSDLVFDKHSGEDVTHGMHGHISYVTVILQVL